MMETNGVFMSQERGRHPRRRGPERWHHRAVHTSLPAQVTLPGPTAWLGCGGHAALDPAAKVTDQSATDGGGVNLGHLLACFGTHRSYQGPVCLGESKLAFFVAV